MNWWSAFVVFEAAILLVHSERLPCFSGKLDVVLVVDVSGSVDTRFMTNRDSAWELARSLPISWEKAVIAVIQYSKLALMKLEFGSSETWETVNDSIANLDWTGDVALTAEAMDLAMIMFRRARADSQRVIVLFSDGNSFNSWQQVIDTSERLKYSHAKIFAVSLAGNTYETELKQYVSFSNGSIIRTHSEFQELKRELLSMTVPRCPPPSAQPPQDFLRPAESNPDGDPENQLPTRAPENQLPTRRQDNLSPTRRTTRRSQNTRTARTTQSTPVTTAPVANAGAATAGPVVAGIPGASIIDASVDKQRE